MLKKFVRLFGGDPNKRTIDRFTPVINEINALEARFEALSDAELRALTDRFRATIASAVAREDEDDPARRRAAEADALTDILPEAFAAVREAAKRTLGLRHYDVQLIGGLVLHEGQIAEMRTGEGKTLVATLPLYLNALTGRGAHLITVNDYLARRDARWMAPIFHLLGLSVGVLQMAARTENGRKAFVVDLSKESPHEDQNQLRLEPRALAYAADITYGTNSEFGFDYLRDNMTMRLEDRVQREHVFAIVDEVDNVLIDEARTPLIISGPAQDEGEGYVRMAQAVRGLTSDDVEINEKDRTVTLTEMGEIHIEEILGEPLRDPDRPEDVTLEQARLLGYLEQALRAQFLYTRNKEYLVQAGKVIIIDEFTGRLMPGRRWSDGLHQAVEAKEGVKVQSESVTYATITIQNYFRMYEKLSGMTGTALTEAEEFAKIYQLEVVAIPTNLEYQAVRGAELAEIEGRDPEGYKYSYYVRQDDPARTPIYYRRKDYPDVVYRTQEIKLRAIAEEVLTYHVLGRPVLVGTTSVELSEQVSNRLRAEPLRRLVQVLLLRATWMERAGREEDGRQIPELLFLNEPLDKLDPAQMRAMSRELNLSFNPEERDNLTRLLKILGLEAGVRERLSAALQGGIPHEVLNARKHTEESQIIAGAGAFGAVTIATNMAGRGVDIKLGGELAEEVLASVNRVLKRAGIEDPYDLTMEQRRAALRKLTPEEMGIYESEVGYFLKFMEDAEQVRALGGLHVIGSERHEARRIDNQLRGRAARQGDPGSSRFYLSMEDELMRLFGGQQADNLMQRMKIDDHLPLEMGLVSRIVEQSQTRVEGANFDVRKHLLEYDDVLNSQRGKIYAQRNLIFTKSDLSENVTDMLRTEIGPRVDTALLESEGPWRLLAWLDQLQPPLQLPDRVFPSYSYSLLLRSILGEAEHIDADRARDALLRIATDALESEAGHILNAAVELLTKAEDRLNERVDERLEGLDTFLEGLDLSDETDTRRPADLLAELNALTRANFKLSPEQQRQLRESPQTIAPALRSSVRQAVQLQEAGRTLGAIERRLNEPLDLTPNGLPLDDWPTLSSIVLNAVEGVLARRRERLLDRDGLVTRDLESALAKLPAELDEQHLLYLLMILPQGARATFDRKTHRKFMQRTTRLVYVYAAARLIEGRDRDEVGEDVLRHLEEAQEAMRQAFGEASLAAAGSATLAETTLRAQRGLRAALGEEAFFAYHDAPLASLPEDARAVVIDELGRQALTENYRQLTLRVISELWVDYLTEMEALRVAIGLEAYAQRDPLVQYKNQASELFQNLMSNMRLGVIGRMFTFRLREPEAATARVETAPRFDRAEPEPAAAAGAPPAPPAPTAQGGSSPEDGGGGKRRRRKR